MNLPGITQGSLDIDRRLGRVRVVRTTHAADTVLERHAHDRPAFTLVTAGAFLEESPGQELECPPGTLLFKPAFSYHRNRYGPQGARSVLIELLWDDPAEVQLPHTPGRLCAPAAVRVAIRLARDVGRTHPSQSAAERRDTENEVLALAALAFGEAVRARAGARPRWLRFAYEQLTDAPRSVPSVKELARDAGVHTDHLIRAFRDAYGETPGVFARHRRARLAAECVSTSDDSLARVASATGYSDQSHMTRELQRFLGVTPGALRRSRVR